MKLIEKLLDYWLSVRGVFYYKFVLKKTCYDSVEIVRARQYRKLKRILTECQLYVPYYKELFQQIGFDVERDFVTLEDIKKIPITTKAVVKKYPEKFRNPHYKGGVQEHHTSGSTGTPLSVVMSNNGWVVVQAVTWRQWSWAGYHFRDKMAIVRSYAPKDGKLIKMEKARNFRYYSPFHLSEDNIKMYIEDMVKEKVKFLRGYPSSVKPLAQYVLKTGCDIPQLKAIFTASEILPDSDRELIEKAFKCKIFNHYGLAEGILQMGDCECHKGLHISDEYGYVEILDTDNPQIKRIIGTCLNNLAMPLLRYETNDLAEIAEEKCPCGRSSATVHNIIGRSNSVIHLEDRDIPLTNFYTMMEYYTNIARWQIVQVGLNKLQLRIQGTLSDEDLAKIKKEFAMRLPESVEQAIMTDAELVQKHEGKVPPFISLL